MPAAEKTDMAGRRMSCSGSRSGGEGRKQPKEKRAVAGSWNRKQQNKKHVEFKKNTETP